MVERRPRIMQWGQGMAIGDKREFGGLPDVDTSASNANATLPSSACPYHAGGIRPYMGNDEPQFLWNKPPRAAT